MRPSREHEEAVARVCEAINGVNTSEFRKAVCLAVGRTPDDLAWDRNVVPDSYVIDERARRIVMVEIVKTGEVRPVKLHALADLWHALHHIGWELRLIVKRVISGAEYELDLRLAFEVAQENRRLHALGQPAATPLRLLVP